MRPGEKLAERLTYSGESVCGTSHPKIFRVLDPDPAEGSLLVELREVRERLERGEIPPAWVALIQAQVPEAEIGN